MSLFMNVLLPLFEGETGTAGGGGLMSIIMIVLLIAVFYFMYRSNKKQEREAAKMRDALEVGDEVTTIGGIVGEIGSVKEETIVVETTKAGTRIRFLKSAVRSVDVSAAVKRGDVAPNAPASNNVSKKLEQAEIAEDKAEEANKEEK